MDMYARIGELSIYQIQVFLKCMELGNYSKAADALGYTPSMVSKTVRKMEEQLGLVLFNRRGGRVVPTAAAEQLYSEWNAAVRAIGIGVERAYAVQAGSQKLIRIGLIDDSDHAEQLFLSRMKAKDPTLSSTVVEKADMHALPGLLKRGRYDLVLTAYHERDQLDGSDCVWELVEYTKLAVFIPKGHPLYDKDDLQIEDFRPYPFVTMDPLTNTGFYEMFLTVCHRWGFEPIIANAVLNSSSMRFSLETSKHLVCGDSIICQWENDHIRKFEIDVPNISGLILAWRKAHEDARLLETIDAICTPLPL